MVTPEQILELLKSEFPEYSFKKKKLPWSYEVIDVKKWRTLGNKFSPQRLTGIREVE